MVNVTNNTHIKVYLLTASVEVRTVYWLLWDHTGWH